MISLLPDRCISDLIQWWNFRGRYRDARYFKSYERGKIWFDFFRFARQYRALIRGGIWCTRINASNREVHTEFGVWIDFRGRGNCSGKIDRDRWTRIEEGETVTPGRDPEKLLASRAREVVGPVLTGILFPRWKFRNLNLSRSWNLGSIRRIRRVDYYLSTSSSSLSRLSTREPSKKEKKL